MRWQSFECLLRAGTALDKHLVDATSIFLIITQRSRSFVQMKEMKSGKPKYLVDVMITDM